MTNRLDRFQQLSPAQQALLLEKLQSSQPQQALPAWSPLVPLQVNPTQPPIFFLHPAGGALFWYLALLKHLGDAYNAYGLQGHGLYGDQQPLTTIPAMAEAYVPLIKAQQPVGPYTLIGYSIGGVIAFEVAQQLLAAGDQIAHLFLLDAYLYTERLPYPGKEIADEEERLIVRMLGALPAGQRRALQTHLRSLPNHGARIDYLFTAGKATGHIPATYTLTDLRRMYEGMDAHVEALHRYHPKPYPGRVTFLRCIDRSESDIAAYISWSAVARQGVQRFDVPGRHSVLMEEPYVQQVANLMQPLLTQEEPIS